MESRSTGVLLPKFIYPITPVFQSSIGGSRFHMTSIVPQSNYRFGRVIVFISQHAQARRAQQEISAARRFEPKPASAEHAQEMAAGKKQNVPMDGAQAAHYSVGPRSDLIRRFSPGTTVTEKLPTRTLRQDFDGAPAFILAVGPFVQVTIDFSRSAEAGKLAGTLRALQGTGKYLGKSQSFQPLSKPAGVTLATFSQRQVSDSRVLTGETPRGLAMSSQIDDGQRFVHAIVPSLASASPPRVAT